MKSRMNATPSLPFWEGTGRAGSRLVKSDATNGRPGFPTLPHPDGFAVCPSSEGEGRIS
jgi:hypothetical protein